MSSRYDAAREALAASLSSIPLRDLLPHHAQNVLTLEHNNTVAEALKVLAKRKVLSAPLVVAPALEDLSNGDVPSGPTLLGWLDVHDILNGLLSHLKDRHKRLPSNMLHLMSELESEGKTFGYKTLITLTGGADRQLVYTGEAGATLMQTIKEQFLGGSTARVVHRIAIFDDDGTITNVVSQLDLVRYMCAHAERMLGALADAPLNELGLPYTRAPLIAVDPNVPTLLAFDHMLEAGVSGAPVLTPAGELIANLSTSDLRCIQPEHLGVLALPVAEFLALLHRTTYLGYSQGASASKDHAFFAGSPPPRQTEGRHEAADHHHHPHHHHHGGGSGSDIVSGSGSAAGANSSQPARSAGLGVDDEVRLITVRPTSTLKEVLHILGDNRIHRVYVLDPDAAPGQQLLGTITPTDILCFAAGAPPPVSSITPHRTFSGSIPAVVPPPPSPSPSPGAQPAPMEVM